MKLAGRRVYLGKHNSQESRDEYDRAIGEWIAAGRCSAPPAAGAAPDLSAGLTVSELVATLVAAFRAHTKGYDAGPDGTPTGELDDFRLALPPFRRSTAPRPPHCSARSI